MNVPGVGKFGHLNEKDKQDGTKLRHIPIVWDIPFHNDTLFSNCALLGVWMFDVASSAMDGRSSYVAQIWVGGHASILVFATPSW